MLFRMRYDSEFCPKWKLVFWGVGVSFLLYKNIGFFFKLESKDEERKRKTKQPLGSEPLRDALSNEV